MTYMYVTLIWIWAFFIFFSIFLALGFYDPFASLSRLLRWLAALPFLVCVVLGVQHRVSCMLNKHCAPRAPSESWIQAAAAAFYFLRHRFTVELRDPSASGVLRLKTTWPWLELLAVWDLLLLGTSPKSDMVPGTSQYSFHVWCRMRCWVCGVSYYFVSNSDYLKVLNYTE